MSSCLLFFGPGARQAALDEANRVGRLLAPPFGDEGLKTDEAREILILMGTLPVGVSKGSVVIGPMDLVLPRASDVLLKRIEEFDDTRIQPIMWAHDSNNVTPTIRSRCLGRWVDVPSDIVDQELVDAGFDLVEAVLSGEFYKVPGIVKKYSKREHDLIGSVADALSTGMNKPGHRVLWDLFRPITFLRNPTEIEIIAALVGGACE